MKLRSHMTISRNDHDLRVGISGTFEPRSGENPGGDRVTNIEAHDYDGEVALSEAEWTEAEELLLLANEKPYDD